MNAIDGMVYLCKCAVNKQKPDCRIVDSLDMEKMFIESKRHMLSSIVGISLQNAGVKDPKFEKAVFSAFRKTVILNNERDLLFAELDKAGIWHMPLKGSVLKDWYPQFGMRESADCDVLFDKNRESDVRSIMLRLGYDVESYGKGHHDVYLKKPVTNMQMHVDLFGTGFEKRLNDYYENIKEKLVLKNRYEYEFTPEDFYIYLLAHNQRDYSSSGTGFRALLDVYVFLTKFSKIIDWNYIKEELVKLQIDSYEEQTRRLALSLFGEEAFTETDEEMLQYIASSGVFGKVRNAVNNQIKDFGGGFVGRIRYVLYRVFIPIDSIKNTYPVFIKYKVFLPFLPLYRLLRGVKRNSKDYSMSGALL